jgi:hypothetical protein
MIGRIVALEKGPAAEVSLLLDGVAVGCLDAPVADKLASAIDRGQVFKAVVENAFPNYEDTGRRSGCGKFKLVGAYLDIKVEYLLEKGHPAIETGKCWRCVDVTEAPRTARSFFTTVAGVTFEAVSGLLLDVPLESVSP